jgi:hypothetical protein
MLLMLGVVVLGVTALTFWLVLPVGGEARLPPRAEPIVTVGLIVGVAAGVVLIAMDIVSILSR